MGQLVMPADLSLLSTEGRLKAYQTACCSLARAPMAWRLETGYPVLVSTHYQDGSTELDLGLPGRGSSLAGN